MVYSHCTGAGTWQGLGIGSMDSNILCRNAHTDKKQGQLPEPRVPNCQSGTLFHPRSWSRVVWISHKQDRNRNWYKEKMKPDLSVHIHTGVGQRPGLMASYCPGPSSRTCPVLTQWEWGICMREGLERSARGVGERARFRSLHRFWSPVWMNF